MWILFVVAGIFAVTQSATGREIGEYRDVEITSCPEPYGLQLYPHPKSCDQFYKCANGTLTLETCGNGLLFDGKGSVHNYCNYHWAVDCEEREYELEPEPGRYSSPYCEYAFGLFKASDGCDLFFYRCAYGEAEEVACEKGLAYDERTHSCNWPDLLLEVGCDPEKVVGFRCPDIASLPSNSLSRQFAPYPRYPLPEGSCSSLVTCVYDYPRLLNCGYGSVFNEYTLGCDDPKNVPKCADYWDGYEE